MQGDNPVAAFETPEALAINAARQNHLAALELELERKCVLEIGAGIGLHTRFFLDRGCEVVVTDGNDENLAEISRRHPDWTVRRLDLLDEDDYVGLELFD